MLEDLLISAIPKFEFPRQSLQFGYIKITHEGEEEDEYTWAFKRPLNLEEVNILATYMIVEWLGQQLASIENVRMKYSGSDFKFTSQANHMQKILQMKKDYEREGFHLQRLYKRRIIDVNGIYHSNMTKIMQPMGNMPNEQRPEDLDQQISEEVNFWNEVTLEEQEEP